MEADLELSDEKEKQDGNLPKKHAHEKGGGDEGEMTYSGK